MKILVKGLFLLFISMASQAEMKLFDCSGKETGKVKGFVAKEQLLLDCFRSVCAATFGSNKFEAKVEEDGTYFAFGSNYFEFDPASGDTQGVVGEPFYYFVGKCKVK
jgi:hypothetical protein